MRFISALIILSILFAAPAQTQQAPPDRGELLTALEYELLSRDRILAYSRGDGVPYGWELHFPGRRVLWTLGDGECKSGTWRADGQAICFLYDGETQSHCWLYQQGEDGLTASLLGGVAPIEGYRVTIWDGALDCPGPAPGS
ncbi:MAG: hypothetical protein ACU0DW_07720 [Shimia sp.]